jgi:hypothetical protein
LTIVEVALELKWLAITTAWLKPVSPFAPAKDVRRPEASQDYPIAQ